MIKQAVRKNLEEASLYSQHDILSVAPELQVFFCCWGLPIFLVQATGSGETAERVN